MREKTFRILEIAGGFVVFAIASFLHFFYDLSGGSVLGALLGSVNESVWEHLKTFAIAYLIWAVIELLWTQPSIKTFVWSKAVGVYALCVFIAGFFYLYTGLLGRSVLALDLACGLIFSLLAHFISYKLTTNEKNQGQFFYTGIMLLFLMFLMILCFTFYPPKDELFRDPATGTYGILYSQFDEGAQVLDAMHTQ